MSSQIISLVQVDGSSRHSVALGKREIITFLPQRCGSGLIQFNSVDRFDEKGIDLNQEILLFRDGLPHQSLINLYLRDCAILEKKLELKRAS